MLIWKNTGWLIGSTGLLWRKKTEGERKRWKQATEVYVHVNKNRRVKETREEWMMRREETSGEETRGGERRHKSKLRAEQ